MLNTEIKESLLIAYEKKELCQYFRGDYPYELENQQFESNFLKTNTSEILLKGVYEVYRTNEELRIDVLFSKILVIMLESKLPLNIYIVAKYLLDQSRYENRNVSPFILNKEKMIPLLLNCLSLEQLKLENYVDSELSVKINLYDEIERIVLLMKSKYGLKAT